MQTVFTRLVWSFQEVERARRKSIANLQSKLSSKAEMQELDTQSHTGLLQLPQACHCSEVSQQSLFLFRAQHLTQLQSLQVCLSNHSKRRRKADSVLVSSGDPCCPQREARVAAYSAQQSAKLRFSQLLQLTLHHQQQIVRTGETLLVTLLPALSIGVHWVMGRQLSAVHKLHLLMMKQMQSASH